MTVQKARRNQSQSTQELANGVPNNIATAQPILVDLPMPEVICQGYMEVQDVAASEVVTVDGYGSAVTNK